MNRASEETYKQLDEEISIAPAPATTNDNRQAAIPKSIVLDPEWLDGDRTRFED